MTSFVFVGQAYALAGTLVILAAIAVYHWTIVRPALARVTALVAAHDELLGGGIGAAERLSSIDASLALVQAESHRVSGRLGELEALARTDVSRIGFVRYDAFDDTGSELSYAVAFLNREGDGAVISSIYSRADTRTFGKAVRGYQPAVNASQEELLAIERARGSTTNI